MLKVDVTLPLTVELVAVITGGFGLQSRHKAAFAEAMIEYGAVPPRRAVLR